MDSPAAKPGRERLPADAESLVESVRERYGRIAVAGSTCCGNSAPADQARLTRELGYAEGEVGCVPAGSNLGLGCGAPVAHLELQPGETVLDLGSGGGLDAFLAAQAVGAGGRVIGVDMTPEMIARAERNAADAGLDQVEFRQGRLEALPLADASVDAVTSNCVINLVPDKTAVFREVARVLRPGGRIVVSDIVLDGTLPLPVASDLMAYVGCLAGALDRERYFANVQAAGLHDVRILRDIDYLAAAESALPEEVAQLLERTGVAPAELHGVVRSLTWRAVRPAG